MSTYQWTYLWFWYFDQQIYMWRQVCEVLWQNVWRNTYLLNTIFFLASMWLFKPSIAVSYVVPASSKCIKMSCTYGLANWTSNALIFELSSASKIQKVSFYFFHRCIIETGLSDFVNDIVLNDIVLKLFNCALSEYSFSPD